jgi:NaMN:DMB phosphoribosyltransferase
LGYLTMMIPKAGSSEEAMIQQARPKAMKFTCLNVTPKPARMKRTNPAMSRRAMKKFMLYGSCFAEVTASGRECVCRLVCELSRGGHSDRI